MRDRNGRLRILTILSLPFYSFILNTLQNHGKGTAVGCAQMKLVSRKIAQRIYPAFCDQSNNEGTCFRRRDCCPRYFAILWTKPRIVDDTPLSSKVGCMVPRFSATPMRFHMPPFLYSVTINSVRSNVTTRTLCSLLLRGVQIGTENGIMSRLTALLND